MYIQNSNILSVNTDIIVNSAHPSLIAGSGISGIIHRAAGPELERYAKPLGPLNPGEAVITPALNLNAKYIIHTICPRYMDGQRGEAEQLASAYSSALAYFKQTSDAKSIAFVSMGTGVYKWPLELAAEIAVRELMKSEFDETVICVMDEQTRDAYRTAKTLMVGN
ncbi:MAG: macro domain-containing protein [Porticoccaceae bacterium]|nr:macro domain-containing protein [Porticoccaceae bacterium]